VGLIQRGEDALNRRQLQAAAPDGPVVFTRASDGATCDLSGRCWLGRTPFRVSDAADGGTRLVFSDRDFLIPVEFMVLGGEFYEPAAGDWFTELLPEGDKRFRVLSVNDEPEARASNPQETRLRVHTKRSEPAGS
jgi:hypothetical protein